VIKLKKGTEVDLALLEPVSSATATKGQQIRFAVTQEVRANGLVGPVVIPKGALATGVVKKVRKGIKGKRDGYLEIEPQKVQIANGSWLKLAQFAPGQDSCSDSEGPCGITLFLYLVIASPVLLVQLVVLAVMTPKLLAERPKREKPVVEGKDVATAACWHYTYYSGAESNVPANASETSQPAVLKELTDLGGCPGSN
jgi:hypothetical protein